MSYKNASTMRLGKYSEMEFLKSRNANKHSFGSWCRSLNQGRCEVEIHQGSFHVTPVSPSLARHQINAVELATIVCFSLFDGELTQRY